MIQSFRHAGLEKLYLTGSKAGIEPEHATKLRRQLTLLNTGQGQASPGDLNHTIRTVQRGIT